MSIEQQLSELTQAINALTAAVIGTVPKAETNAKKPTTVTKTEKPAATPPTVMAPDVPEAKAAPSEPAQDSVIDFATQIQKPIVALAATGKRAEALAILKELGATKASDIKPEDYPRAIKLISQAT